MENSEVKWWEKYVTSSAAIYEWMAEGEKEKVQEKMKYGLVARNVISTMTESQDS